MALAHAETRGNIARAAARVGVRRYAAAVRATISDVWSTAQTQRWYQRRDAELAALLAIYAAILAERTAALMIDSGRRMVAEVAAIDAHASAMAMRL